MCTGVILIPPLFIIQFQINSKMVAMIPWLTFQKFPQGSSPPLSLYHWEIILIMVENATYEPYLDALTQHVCIWLQWGHFHQSSILNLMHVCTDFIFLHFCAQSLYTQVTVKAHKPLVSSSLQWMVFHLYFHVLAFVHLHIVKLNFNIHLYTLNISEYLICWLSQWVDYAIVMKLHLSICCHQLQY